MNRSLCNGTIPLSAETDFPLREITGSWTSLEGKTAVRVFRNESRKSGGFLLELAYNNPQAVLLCPVINVKGIHYIDLYGRIYLSYDVERDVLYLSGYGEYIRVWD